MRFSWTGLLLAPLLVPVLVSTALVGAFGSDRPALSLLVLPVPGCIVSYGTMIGFFPAWFSCRGIER